MASCVVFIPVFFHFDLIVSKILINNSSLPKDEIRGCQYTSLFGTVLVSTINLFVRIVIPFILMISVSVLLIISVFKLRNRITRNFLATTQSQVNENKRLKKEMRIAITSILLNILYLVFNLPIAVYSATPNYALNNLLLSALVSFFYLSTATNFYMVFVSNRLVRNEFLNMFCFKR